MNEPGDALIPHPHVSRLARASVLHPMLKHLKHKPRYGLTLGMGDIFRSRKILLLVSGVRKRAALKRLRIPRVSARFPGSFLWLHPDAMVLCDREAYGSTGERGDRSFAIRAPKYSLVATPSVSVLSLKI